MDIKSLSDEELVVLAQNKNDEAFSEIIERYKYLIKSIIRPFFLVGGDSEDLMQYGMIAVFKAVESFNGKSGFKSYAYRCIKNAIITVVRQYNTDSNKPINNYIPLTGLFDGDDDKNLAFANSQENPEDSFLDLEAETEYMAKLKGILSSLEYKIACLFLQGYSYKEMSKQMDKTEKSINFRYLFSYSL